MSIYTYMYISCNAWQKALLQCLECVLQSKDVYSLFIKLCSEKERLLYTGICC